MFRYLHIITFVDTLNVCAKILLLINKSLISDALKLNSHTIIEVGKLDIKDVDKTWLQLHILFERHSSTCCQCGLFHCTGPNIRSPIQLQLMVIAIVSVKGFHHSI